MVRKSSWPPRAADQHVRAGDVAAAGQVETDERDHARAGGDVAGRDLERRDIRCQRGIGLARIGEHAEQRNARHGGRGARKAVRQKIAAGDRPRDGSGGAAGRADPGARLRRIFMAVPRYQNLYLISVVALPSTVAQTALVMVWVRVGVCTQVGSLTLQFTRSVIRL